MPETSNTFDLGILVFHLRNTSPFLGSLALFAETVETDSIPTAATDGRRLLFNPSFMAGHPVPEQLGILVHELLHAALRHTERREGADPLVWNVAADIVVNKIIDDTNHIRLPSSALRNPRIAHFPVEEVYHILLKRAQKKTIAFIGADLLEPDANDTGDLRDHWNQALNRAAAIAAIGGAGIGNLPANLLRAIEHSNNPPLDWRTLLWHHLTAIPFDFTTHDRRFIAQGLYIDTLDGETASVAVCIDTSGSIGNNEIAAFLNETRAIVQAYPLIEVDLYSCDTSLHGPWPISAEDPFTPPIRGGGGTCFKPFFEALAKNHTPPDIAVYLTDGYGTFPDREPDHATLWVVTPGGLDSPAFPFGRIARMLDSRPAP